MKGEIKMKMWYESDINKNSNSVISTRVRLARNLSDIPFPNFMSLEQKNDVISKVEKVLLKASFIKNTKLNKIDMQKLNDVEANALVERRLISPAFAKNRDGKALFASEDEKISVMVNEEDHIRIQVFSQGSDLPLCLKIANEVDNLLEKNLSYAFDNNLGYLTQCPTNLGTGLRASVMLHLPMLQQEGLIENLSGTISKLGMTVRGSMGEGSNVRGALYQISNQVTLGISEQSAIDNLMSIVNQVIKQEESLRQSAYKSDAIGLEDKVYRAYGLLLNARLISTDELLKLVSLLKLGVSLGILKIEDSKLNKLIFESGAYNLNLKLKDNSSINRDKLRAELTRQTVGA